MIESQVLDELKTEWTVAATARHVLRALEIRFAAVPEELQVEVRVIRDPGRLDALLRPAVLCESLAAFRAELP